jgi:glycerol-3-phosphate acyltransferase PlsY
MRLNWASRIADDRLRRRGGFRRAPVPGVLSSFQGGKGVATAAGVLLALKHGAGRASRCSPGSSWRTIFRYLVAGLAGRPAAFAPFYQLLIWGASTQVLAIAVMSLLLIWRHEANIRKLLAGTESRLGQKAAASHPPAHDGATSGSHAAGRHHRSRKGH